MGGVVRPQEVEPQVRHQVPEEEVEVESHGHRQMGGLKMSGKRMGRSGEIGCVKVIDEVDLSLGSLG